LKIKRDKRKGGKAGQDLGNITAWARGTVLVKNIIVLLFATVADKT
jgi:hypothetical protein